jgi:ribokinase
MVRRVLVYGPAYLDRVLRVEGPLVEPELGGPLDRSVEAGSLSPGGPMLRVVDPEGSSLEIWPPTGWPGPSGILRVGSCLTMPGGWRREVRGLGWLDDLGGMGAGYAKAFGGVLVSALGESEDPMTVRVRSLLSDYGIDARPVYLAGRKADWTLLVTSGGSGDKLPIGFRGCHSGLSGVPAAEDLGLRADLVVAAGLSNGVVEARLRGARGAVR